MRNQDRKKILARIMLVMMLLAVCFGAGAATVEYTVNYWVEKPNLFGDPGDPTFNEADKDNFMLVKQEEKKGNAADTVMLTEKEAGQYLRTTEKERRYASFMVSGELELSELGMNEVDVYYVRDLITYEFDLVNEQAQMTIGGETYTGGGEEKYTVRGKYEQEVMIPGMENGLMPTTDDPVQVQNGVYCAGWTLDPRTKDDQLMAYTKVVTESMLPTDDMPYEDLVFTLSGVWLRAADTSLLVAWYEETPEEAAMERNRMNYKDKVYVNYPESNYECILPAGTKPELGDAPGLILREVLSPDTTKEGIEARTWQFIYDRDRFTVTLDTGGSGSIPSTQMMFQQNLNPLNPGWNESTTRTEGGNVYRFIGWHTDNGDFVTYNLGAVYMPARNLKLTARWVQE